MRILLAALVVAAGFLGNTAAAHAYQCFDVTATIVGTNGDDHIQGTNGRDVIVGLGGNDTISGFGDSDLDDGTIIARPAQEDEVAMKLLRTLSIVSRRRWLAGADPAPTVGVPPPKKKAAAPTAEAQPKPARPARCPTAETAPTDAEPSPPSRPDTPPNPDTIPSPDAAPPAAGGVARARRSPTCVSGVAGD